MSTITLEPTTEPQIEPVESNPTPVEDPLIKQLQTAIAIIEEHGWERNTWRNPVTGGPCIVGSLNLAAGRSVGHYLGVTEYIAPDLTTAFSALGFRDLEAAISWNAEAADKRAVLNRLQEGIAHRQAFLESCARPLRRWTAAQLAGAF